MVMGVGWLCIFWGGDGEVSRDVCWWSGSWVSACGWGGASMSPPHTPTHTHHTPLHTPPPHQAHQTRTHMELPPQLAFPAAFDVDALVQREADQVQGLVHRRHLLIDVAG